MTITIKPNIGLDFQFAMRRYTSDIYENSMDENNDTRKAKSIAKKALKDRLTTKYIMPIVETAIDQSPLQIDSCKINIDKNTNISIILEFPDVSIFNKNQSKYFCTIAEYRELIKQVERKIENDIFMLGV